MPVVRLQTPRITYLYGYLELRLGLLRVFGFRV